MATLYQITPGTLSSNCYPAAPQTLYNEMFEKAAVSLNLTGIILSTSAPAATDRDKLWIKLSGTAPLRQYIYSQGEWLWPHEIPNNDPRRFLWVGSLAALKTLDGGVDEDPGEWSGPFWEEDTAFQDRIPMGVGSSLAALVATDYGDTDAQVSIADVNVPSHKHFIATPELFNSVTNHINASQQTAFSNQGGNIGDQDYTFVGSDTAASVGLTSAFGETTPTALNVLNPVRGVYYIKRTELRIYHKG